MSVHNRTHPLTPMASAGSFLCYQLYEGGKTIGTLGLNGLQLVLICIASLFVAFLLFRLPASIKKIRDNPAPLRTLYYCILWIISLINFARLLLSWLLWRNIDAGGEILWIVTGSIIFAVEVSIIVFLFSPADDPKSVARRVIIVTLIASLVFAVVQAIIMFVGGVKIYDYTKSSMWYWTPLNLAKLAVYVVILSLPCINCAIALPRKRSFYIYATLLVAMHLLNLVGDSLVFADATEIGFCFIDTSVILYYTLFPPVLYFSFLWEFFHNETTRPLFDEIEYEQIN